CRLRRWFLHRPSRLDPSQKHYHGNARKRTENARVDLFHAVPASRLLFPSSRITVSTDANGKPRNTLVYGDITEAILTAARKVHSRMGPGLLERPYKVCLGIELERAGMSYQTEKTLPVIYDGETIPLGYRVDFIV